jgi:hypothetical protein
MTIINDTHISTNKPTMEKKQKTNDFFAFNVKCNLKTVH